MKNIVTVSVIAVALVIAFFISLDWSNGLDYSDPYASMAPIAITWMLGVFAISAFGGIIGAIYDYKDEN